MLTGLIVATPAHADENCYTVHCYAVAQTPDAFSLGTVFQAPDAYLAVNPTYAGYWSHINSEAWSLLDNGDYLEAGIRNGYTTSAGCSCYGTFYFWADHTVVGGTDTEYFHQFGTVTINPNQQNVYKFVRCGAIYTWCFLFDGTQYGTSTRTGDQGGNWNIRHLQIGGEVAATTCANTAVAANNRLMYGYLINTNWVQVPAPATALQIDTDCGLTGSTGGVSGDWSWQKGTPPP